MCASINSRAGLTKLEETEKEIYSNRGSQNQLGVLVRSDGRGVSLSLHTNHSSFTLFDHHSSREHRYGQQDHMRTFDGHIYAAVATVGSNMTLIQPSCLVSKFLYASSTFMSGAVWVRILEGSAAPLCTSPISRGMYARWLQFPIRIVRFLFIAVPMGKVCAASG